MSRLRMFAWFRRRQERVDVIIEGNLLLESGDFLLLENGDNLAL